MYVTGRSVHGGPTTDNVPGTIEETAGDVRDRGSRGIALAKNAVARLVWAMAQELREHGIAALAVAPGFMRTERVVEAFRRAGVLDAIDRPGGPTETPAYLGRAIVALMSDARVIEKSGQVLEVGTLAREYCFTDINGTQPPPFRIPAST